MAPVRKALHENEGVRKYLVESTPEKKELSVNESKIVSLSSGLMAKEDIDKGCQIFKSMSFITCIDFSVTTICYHCLKGGGRLPLGDGVVPSTEPKECHTKGWKRFHKDECGILREFPNLTLPHLILYRILFWKKRNKITDKVAKVLSLLDDHFGEYSDAESGDAFFELASSIRATANPDVALNVVFRLLAAIQTNAIKLRHAEKSGSVGIALDLLSCAINHSCEPNAFLYLEDGRVIARSLRPIKSDEEVTISYCEPMLPLATRRDYLEAEYFFRCFCKRCETDKREEKALVPNAVKSLKDLRNIQIAMVRLMNNTVSATNTPGKHPGFENITKMEADILGLSRRVLKDGAWPEHLDPMPLVRNRLAQIYLNKDEHLSALRNSLRGTLMSRYHNGPEWVNNLCLLAQCLVAIATLSPDSSFFNGGGFITMKETKCAIGGYGLRLCKDASTVFGGKSKYTEFLCEWYSWIARSSDDPKPGTKEFEGLFWEAQKSLLEWADVDTGYGIDLGEMDASNIDEMCAKAFNKLSIK
ncbi:hypothetical protein GE09DRAFT_1293300 [Coniochaeta sp. 2T2.1]|nr:hypothetical protein GE09DRAFT_1293300 [Coniochaeta sp. 2T2.1]